MSLKLIFQFLILTFIVAGVIIFFLKKVLFDSTQGAVNRLNRETEEVRRKQAELNEKIKLANEELAKRRAEADALVAKMQQDAAEKANAEREKIVTKARKESEEIINKAQKTKDDMRKAIEQQMDLKAMDFSALILHEVLTEKSEVALHECLVDEFIKDLKNIDMDMIDSKLDTAEITSALSLSDERKKALSSIIQERLKREINLNCVDDKSIISGMILRFGNLTLDGSLQSMIKEKGNELKEKLEKGLLKLGA